MFFFPKKSNHVKCFTQTCIYLQRHKRGTVINKWINKTSANIYLFSALGDWCWRSSEASLWPSCASPFPRNQFQSFLCPPHMRSWYHGSWYRIQSSSSLSWRGCVLFPSGCFKGLNKKSRGFLFRSLVFPACLCLKPYGWSERRISSAALLSRPKKKEKSNIESYSFSV